MTGDHDILVAVRAAAKAAWHVGQGKLDHDACLSEAHEAVALAIRTFDPTRGCSLSTYSANRARWQARKLLRTSSSQIPMPAAWFEARPRPSAFLLEEMFDGTELEIVTLSVNYRYTYREIARILGISYYRINAIMKHVRRKLQDWNLGSRSPIGRPDVNTTS
jgi:DNA-directed RNA polymerase specialized sigma subunit